MATRCARVIAVVGILLLGAATPAGAAEYGIDVSNWQHPYGASINWQAIKDSGRTFVFIKATGGPTGSNGPVTNAYFSADRRDAGAVGLLRGAYHKAEPTLPVTDSALAQARYFVAVTGSMQGPLDLPPVLDIESTGGLNPAQMVDWIGTWLNEIERLSGRRPIIYTGLSFWNTATGGSAAFAGYRLWFARYVAGNSPGQLPNGFPTWTFWQQSNTGTVPGITGAVDLDVYCCSPATLASLAGSSNAYGGSPFGVVDRADAGPDGRLSVSGWSIDPDVVGPIETHVYVDGVGVNLGPTARDRPDLASAGYGQFGTVHGFAWSGTGYAPGPHSLCVFAINQSYGANTLLECRTVTVASGPPVGVLDVVSTGPDGALHLSGWSLDPDVSGPLQTHVYIDGVGTNLGLTAVDRPDVAAAFPGGYSTRRGFAWSTGGLAPGPHSVCVFAINIGAGANTLIRCAIAFVPGGDPFGSVDQINAAPGHSANVSGWTIDPDTAAPTPVHVYIDGTGFNTGPAFAARPDVAAAVAGFGAAHGYFWTSPPLTPGAHSVCVFAINIGVGTNTLMRCAVVSV